jgi:hypothetical protein
LHFQRSPTRVSGQLGLSVGNEDRCHQMQVTRRLAASAAQADPH